MERRNAAVERRNDVVERRNATVERRSAVEGISLRIWYFQNYRMTRYFQTLSSLL